MSADIELKADLKMDVIARLRKAGRLESLTGVNFDIVSEGGVVILSANDMCFAAGKLTWQAARIAELEAEALSRVSTPTVVGGEEGSSCTDLSAHVAIATETDTRCDLDFGSIASAAFLQVTGVSIDAMETSTQQFYINFAVQVAALSAHPPSGAATVKPCGSEDGA